MATSEKRGEETGKIGAEDKEIQTTVYKINKM